MPKAIVIAIHRTSFGLAFDSMKNSLKLLADFMYGTPERVHVTYAFALVLALLGGLYDAAGSASILQNCAVN